MLPKEEQLSMAQAEIGRLRQELEEARKLQSEQATTISDLQAQHGRLEDIIKAEREENKRLNQLMGEQTKLEKIRLEQHARDQEGIRALQRQLERAGASNRALNKSLAEVTRERDHLKRTIAVLTTAIDRAKKALQSFFSRTAALEILQNIKLPTPAESAVKKDDLANTPFNSGE
jgi:predicted  nucleic acid-binding Zn-ribbon protein